MKILITGFNRNQSNRMFYLGQQLKVVPSTYSLYNCLADMGHQVDHREVVIGEDLSSYDEIIVFIAAPRQLVTTKLFNGLWAVSQKPNCILASDDWAMPDLYKGVEKCLKTNDLTCDFVLGCNKTTKEEVEKYLPQYRLALETIAAKKNKLLISAFIGGDLSLLMPDYPKNLMYAYDPHPYHRNRKPGDCWDDGIENPHYVGSLDIGDVPSVLPEDKIKTFNFASLVQSKTKSWLKKQKIENWPVHMIGSRADGQDRYTEAEMCRSIISKQWGVLMPGYKHAGSGWWRTKFQQAADFGSIIIGDDKELEVIYGPAFKGLTASKIEKMSVEELTMTAKLQRRLFYEKHEPLNKQKQQHYIKRCLDGVDNL